MSHLDFKKSFFLIFLFYPFNSLPRLDSILRKVNFYGSLTLEMVMVPLPSSKPKFPIPKYITMKQYSQPTFFFYNLTIYEVCLNIITCMCYMKSTDNNTSEYLMGMFCMVDTLMSI